MSARRGQHPLRRETRLVTLSFGGNDVGFAGCLHPDHGKDTCWDHRLTAADKVIGDQTPKTSLQARLANLYQAVRDAAPNAHIVVLTYPA
ncbi:hypothetical protein QRX60_32145 [Amycolatopsis mongoliensis]|uniref:SGNH hydrolase-type esterase domain-containing protein n=1 Tax=Amycolatopsis mongoliensis TaxID=715475 RepID=A0A9Y2JJT6_9PSEU|nr:hypothetical protein [Amycolatopsis sp. 4-36]WIX98701.1 hypothetical protein QRX60_32145 [Amycolatopsis sp. 4-36]